MTFNAKRQTWRLARPNSAARPDPAIREPLADAAQAGLGASGQWLGAQALIAGRLLGAYAGRVRRMIAISPGGYCGDTGLARGGV